MRTALAISCALALHALSGCATLDPLTPGACGNGVIDADEDCDTFPEKAGDDGQRCRAPGATGACHFECGANEGEKLQCPAGYGCGGDSICRRPSGRFAGASASLDTPAAELFSGDFDGDGRHDAIVVNESGFKAIYIGASGAFEQNVDLPFASLRPAIGDLNNDGIDDVVANVGEGIGVFRGRGDRTFSPTAYSSIFVPQANTKIMGADALPQIPGQEPMALSSVQDGSLHITALLHITPTSVATVDPDIMQFMPGDAEALPERIPIGQLDEDPALSPCEEIVAPFEGAASVAILFTCRQNADTGVIELNFQKKSPMDLFGPDLPAYRPAEAVTLSGGATVSRGAHLHDLDGDGHLDLIIGVTGGTSAVQVAYGVGDGTFHSDKATIPIVLGDNVAVPAPEFPTFPLAVGDIDGDGSPDFVTEYGIYASGPSIGSVPCGDFGSGSSGVGSGSGGGGAGGGGGSGGSGGGGGAGGAGGAYHAIACAPQSWTEARIADLNGNGLLDVIAANGFKSGLDFYNGAGGGFLNHYAVKTDGVARHLTIGDFDGDLILDVAVSQSSTSVGVDMSSGSGGDTETPGSTGASDDLAVLFGRPTGAPEAPISMGQFAPIVQMVEAHITIGYNQVADAISELGVVSQLTSTDGLPALSVAVLTGSSDRHLLSPFLFSNTIAGKPYANAPLLSVVGELADSGEPHLDICTLTRQTTGDSDLGGKTTFHLWVARSTGDALIEPSGLATNTKISEAVPDAASLVQGLEPLVAAVDLDRDGVDEVVMLFLRYDGQSFPEGEIIVYRAKDGVLVADPPQHGGDLFVAATLYGFNQLQVRDVDADGYPDLVTITVAIDGSSSQVVVLWNDQGAIELTNRTQIVLPPDDFPAYFTTIEADGDPGLEIAVATSAATYLVDVADRTAGEPVVLDNIVAALALVARDFTGDGVDDLLVGGYAGVELHPGIARNP